MSSHESMSFDVVIVGGGPAGLSAAIRLGQLNQTQGTSLNMALIDKGADIGSHILSGAVLQPTALNELLPDWQKETDFDYTPVTEDRFLLLTEKKSWRLPTPPLMKNHGNLMMSLGQLCRSLAKQAESLNITVLPGFAATEIVYENNCVVGVVLGEKGVDVKGNPKKTYQPGLTLYAKQIIFAEGCRGSLTETLFSRFDLRKDCDLQTYALGLKEIWEIPDHLHQKGLVIHTVGFPLSHDTYGGSFIYHWGKNLLSIGLVIGLDYANPYLNLYEEFQRFKSHPFIYSLLKQSRRIAYGARTLIEGGWQSIPKLSFPGGVIVGDGAGLVNVPKIKGIHNAMKSGMIAADCIFNLLQKQSAPMECIDYPNQFKESMIADELYQVRNIRPAFRYGLWLGLGYAAIDTYLLKGRAPWTFRNRLSDRARLKKITQCARIHYPAHDNQVTFDLPSSLYLSNIQYDENQPYHLKIKNKQAMIDINLKEYASPETRYCPAGVYEIVEGDHNTHRLMIHGGNCIQCKACDIKDPTKNITWTPSEGGSGPQYEIM